MHCRKIYNVCVRALAASRKISLWRAFLSCFAAIANVFYIFRQCTYIVYILQCQSPKTTAKLSNKLTNKRRSKVFDGVLCHVRAHTVRFLPSLIMNMNQVPVKLWIGKWPYITSIYPVCAGYALFV